MEETRGPGENHWPVASHWQTWSNNVVNERLPDLTPHSTLLDVGVSYKNIQQTSNFD